jgi:uncharacterized protein (TIGR02452 family)
MWSAREVTSEMKTIQVPFIMERAGGAAAGQRRQPAWFDPHSPAIRQQIWFATLKHYEGKPPISRPSEKHSYVPTAADIGVARGAHQTTEITIVDQDCLYAAEKLRTDKYRPMVLNMADWRIAGGCIGTGARTQEEELFRRSDYHRHLLQGFYPLDTYDVVVSHDVEVYRNGPDTDYAIRAEPFLCSMIASPALDNPELAEDGVSLTEADAAIMYNKMRQLIYYTVQSGCDSLVLSAWGCGAFRLPARQIAELFRTVLSECDGCLRKVVFAITNYKGNYEVFCNAFGVGAA